MLLCISLAAWDPRPSKFYQLMEKTKDPFSLVCQVLQTFAGLPSYQLLKTMAANGSPQGLVAPH